MTEITSGADLAAMLFDEPPAEQEAPAAEAQGDAQEPDAEAAQTEPEADAAAPDEPEDEIFIVTENGKEVEITKEELLRQRMFHADYTRKTQELAEQRRAHEAQAAAEVEALKRALTVYSLPTTVEPKPEDFQGQPEKFIEAYSQFRATQERQAKAAELLETLTAQETQRVVAREIELLHAALPEWATNQSVRDADLARIQEVGTARYGFTAEELSSVTDHRIILLLRDASRVAALDSKPIEMQRKTAVAPKMEPGTKQKMNTIEIKRKVAMDKLKSSGRLTSADDQVALLYDT